MRKTSIIGLGSAAAAMAMLAASVGGVVMVGDGGTSATFAKARASDPAARNKAPTQPKAAAPWNSGTYFRGTKRRRAGYGWTNAHARRVYRKARNIKRHRESAKG
ncbi:hypothetical protein [Rhodoferax sp. BLA1]|uniref:hypothetical protein n=1 Tax=Rhodoferax sp. BLA1 TaxID=2576062 RepID=UPI0015D2AF45|nr:hypothetical protein [Rhodoferax sp. BLA1]